MSTTTDLSTLKINYLTKSQYDTAKAQGLIESNEIYMTPEDSLLRSKVGAIVAYAGSDEPQGWFKCDGRAVSRTDYAELYEVIGTTYGSGDGSTTFNIPDLRGRVVTGVGTLSGNTYTLGDDVDAGLPNITGTLYQRSTNYNVSNITWTGGGALAASDDTSGWTADPLSQVNGAVARKKIDLNASNSNSIYGNSTTVQPNTLALNFLICYENHSIGGSGSGGPVDSTDEPTATKIAEFDSNAHMNSTDMTTQALETYVDSLDIQGSVFVDATEVPTAGEIAKFDSTANMSSTDMTTGSGSELEDFINGLNISSGSTFLNIFYPVGAYFETSDSTFNPNVAWGGTWELETEGQVHIGAGTTYTIDGALTNTTDGGETTHTLTAAQTYRTHEIRNTGTLNSTHSVSSITSGNKHKIPTSTTNFTKISDSPSPHNNMQPYIIVNRWHRIA